MRKLCLATRNPGKLRELRSLLRNCGFHLASLDQLGVSEDVEESGSTFAENAALKARAYARSAGVLTLADDSGLEVDVLGGKPGIYSARFSPKPGATDADRRAYLLGLLHNRPQHWNARFRCIAALANPAGEVYFAEGVCEGEIIADERGQNGFGYDPIFFLPKLGRTMAELSMAEKNRLSHRARAIMAIRPTLDRLRGA